MFGRKKVRYAVVGLGYIAQSAVLPSFAHASKSSELAALVSDDAQKLKQLGKKYKVARCVTYDEYDDLLRSGDIDAVYIALPNTLHRDYTVRAAKAGVHVLCEKPMAVSEKECQDMIRACDQAGVKLMVAYRLHFEEANLRALKIARDGKLGELKLFDSVFTMNVKPGDIRLQRRLGGGTLYDIGIYCINAARHVFGAEPLEVLAVSVRGTDERFKEVDELTSATLRFVGDRIASFTCSFGASEVSEYRIVGTKGDLLLVDPAYKFVGELRHRLTLNGRSKETSFRSRDQFAPELLHFSDCVLSGKDPEPSGSEGLADVRIITALYR